VFSAPAVESPDVQARAGTVLLHQVGRLGRAVQSRLADRLVLLRAQTRPHWARWRLLASTSEALLARVADGTFDDRLYYRLNVIHLVIPSGRPIRSTRRVLGADEAFLLTRGVAHDGSVHVPTARRGSPRPGLRTW
jgi:transcriptional regulator of acetoin/glycerol metabolism